MKKVIETVRAFELLDSRGNPTVGVHIGLSDGSKGFSIVPSGASTGSHEALELRDGDQKRYGGKGVLKALGNVETVIAPALVTHQPADQSTFDTLLLELDGTPEKTKLGANAMLACSLAFARACAAAYKMPLYRLLGGVRGTMLPVPMMNILNGGSHAANNVDIQEFMIVPIGIESFAEQLRAGSEIYHALGKLLRDSGLATGVGDEGGFAPSLSRDEQALDLITEAIEKAGYNTNEIKIALDVAASEWVCDEGYRLTKKGEVCTVDGLISRYEKLVADYPILSIEDGLGEDDNTGWQAMTARLGSKVMLVGDDLFVTNSERLAFGISRGIANTILIKPNQIGTLSETMDVISLADQNGYGSVISHRSGESEDSFIADLAVAVNAPFIKTGAPCRGERTAKYNRLLMIEKEL